MDRRLTSGQSSVSRRSVLRAVGASGIVGLAGCSGGESGTPTGERVGNYPVTGDTVYFGFNVAQSGQFSSEGEAELRGHRMALKHINEGGGWVGEGGFGPLDGDGLLGKTVKAVEGDTNSDAETARNSALGMIDSDDVIMFSGGSTSETALAHQEVAAEKEVVYMSTMSHTGTVTGDACNRYSFREMFNSYMTAKALTPVLVDEYGEDAQFFQVYSRDDWGEAQKDLMESFLSDAGWQPVGSLSSQVGTRDFSQYTSDIDNASEDVLILNLRGLDAANAIRAVRKEFPEENIVVPLCTGATAQTAGGAMEGIIGTIAWDPTIDTPLSDNFESAYAEDYEGGTASSTGPAHIAYTQTLQYANAVARAGTFDPNEVIAALEDYEYAAGVGAQTMRACDHQSMRPVPVVRGRSADRRTLGRYYDLIEITRDVTYACDEGPAANCSLGGN